VLKICAATRGEIVNHRHALVALEQLIYNVATDEPSSSSDDVFHGVPIEMIHRFIEEAFSEKCSARILSFGTADISDLMASPNRINSEFDTR
jgi:hypothetical protein